MIRSCLIIVLCLLQVSQSIATISLANNNQYTPYTPYLTPAPVYNYNITPSNVQFGTQYYDLNLYGLRNLINENYSENQIKEYEQLNKSLSKLERSSSLAKWSFGLISLLGIAYAAYAPIPQKKSWCEYYLKDGSCLVTYDNESDINTAKSNNLYAGLGFVLIGLGVGIALEPKRTDFIDFVNQHNRLFPQNPIKINIGLWPTPFQKPGLGIAFTF